MESVSLFRSSVIQITCTQPPSCSGSPSLNPVEVGCESKFASSDSALNVWPKLKPTVFLRLHTQANSIVSCEVDGFISHTSHLEQGTRCCRLIEGTIGGVMLKWLVEVSPSSLPHHIVITAETETAAQLGKESRVKPIRVSVLMVSQSKLSSSGLLRDFSRQRLEKKELSPAEQIFNTLKPARKVLIRGKTHPYSCSNLVSSTQMPQPNMQVQSWCWDQQICQQMNRFITRFVHIEKSGSLILVSGLFWC